MNTTAQHTQANDIDFSRFVDSIRILNESLGKITETMNLSTSMPIITTPNKIPSPTQTSKANISLNLPHVDQRFEDLNIPIPQINKNLKQEQVSLIIEEFIGMACKKVFSLGFSLFRNERILEKQMKVFCSQKLLLVLVRFIKENDLKVFEVKKINMCLKIKILPYFQAKYPLSQEAANVSFSNFVIPKDNLDDEESDLVFHSKVQFKFKRSKNYNSEIMKFLNFLIDQTQSKKKKFQQNMKDIFQMVFKQQSTMVMQKFDPKNPIIEKDENCDKDNVDKNKEFQYRKKVKSFTSYHIATKIPDSIKKFTEREIQSGDLEIRNPALMRILTKWCKELQSYYKKQILLRREKPFRMRDGSIDFIKRKWMIKILSALLQKSYEQFPREYQKKAKGHGYESLTTFAKQDIPKQMYIYSEEEATVGNFSGIMLQYCENYLKKYLNILIHGIMVATRDFENIVKAKDRLKKQIKLFEENETQSSLQQLIKKSRHHNGGFVQTCNRIPCLITFKIGDLFRCKCSSKQQEIKALYCEIEKRSFQNPEGLKIVRTKNKLQKGTRDILINILYQNEMVIQMQLAIKTDQSKFIESSSSFCHYLYQLQRSLFGPINQMCMIWMTKDERSKFFTDIINKNNNRIPKPSNLLLVNKSPISLPFKCDSCQYHYIDCQQSQGHYQYNTYDLKKWRKCFLCHFESLNENGKLKQLKIDKEKFSNEQIQFVSDFDGTQLVKNLPCESWIVNLKLTNKKVQKLFRYENSKKIMFLTPKNQQKNKFNFVAEVMKQNETMQKQNFNTNNRKKLLIQNIIIKKKQHQKQLNKQLIKMIEQNYILPLYIKKCKNIGRNSVTFIKEDIGDIDFFKKQPNKTNNKYLMKLNLSENKIEHISIVAQKIPNLKVLILSFNKIKIIPSNINNLQKLTVLILKGNEISQLPESFGQLKSLENLCLSNNQIESFPKQLFKLNSLKKLNLASNQLTSLAFLQIIKIAKLPSSIILRPVLNLSTLTQLDLSNNKLKILPNQFRQMAKLKSLSISGNYFQRIPRSLKQLGKLQLLNISNNQLKKPLEQTIQIGQLKKLKYLLMSKVNLKSLPKQIGELNGLQIMDLGNNYLEILPVQIGKLTALKQLYISKNKLTELPQSIGNLRSLTLLEITDNDLRSLPAKIGNLIQLKQLYLQNNKLRTLPEQIGQLTSLTQFNISNNDLIITIPNSLFDLKISNFNYSSRNFLFDINIKIKQQEKKNGWKLNQNQNEQLNTRQLNKWSNNF